MLTAIAAAAMFKLNPNPTFECTVTIGAGDNAAPLGLLFKHLSRNAFREWFAQAPAIAAIPDDAQRDRADAAWLGQVIHGWGASNFPVGADDQPVPYSPQALETLLNDHPSASAAIFHGYRRALFEARSGN